MSSCRPIGLQYTLETYRVRLLNVRIDASLFPKLKCLTVRLFLHTTIILLAFFIQIVITIFILSLQTTEFNVVDIKSSYCEDVNHCVQIMISVLPKKEKQLERHLAVTWVCLKTHSWQFSGIQSINLYDYCSCHLQFSTETYFPGNIFIALLQY